MTTLRRVKIKVFLKSRKNADFGLEGVDYRLSPYISGVWEGETMAYITSQVLLLKAHISKFSLLCLHHSPLKLLT
jgi:hypothetical protein